MNLRFALCLFLGAGQIGVPAYLISQHELALQRGRVFKFQTAPVDPYDAFRGRYVALSFDAHTAPSKDTIERGTKLWAVLTEDEHGFAKIERVSREKITADNVIPVTAEWSSGEDTLTVSWPFDRYYLEESAAPRAEAAYRENSRRGEQNAYVTVRVYRGTAAVEELFIAGKPIRQFLREEPPAPPPSSP
jgi:uncharacterized membrane-anchored protein